jgi:MFS family permease
LLALAVVGLGGVLVMASTNTLLQSLTEEQKRGRVMSIFVMAFTGTMPLGNLAVGAVAHAGGPALALIISGIACVLIGFNFYRQLPELRAAAAPLLTKALPPEA